MNDNVAEGRAQRRVKWSILLSIGLLVATLAVGIWLAFSIKAPTEVTINQTTGAISVTGPESEFVGSASGRFRGKMVSISGLPAYEQIRKDRTAWRALCAIRNDPRTDWSQASEMLHSHLTSGAMNELCSPFS